MLNEFEYSSTKNGVADISSQATIDAHLAKVFSLSDLSEQQCLILSAMTIVPYNGMVQTDFENAMKLSLTDNTVNVLVKYGWITKKNGVISLHQAVSDYLYRAEKTKPDWERLDDFIKSKELFVLTHYDKKMSQEQKDELMITLDFLRKKINGDTVGCGEMYIFIAVAYCRIKENDIALDIFTKAKSVFRKHNLTEADEMIYYWTGIAKHNLGRYKDAIDDLKKSINAKTTHTSSATGISYYMPKQYNANLESYQLSIIENTTTAYRYYWLALSCYRLQQYNDAPFDEVRYYLELSADTCFKMYDEVKATCESYHVGRDIVILLEQYGEAVENIERYLVICRELYSYLHKQAEEFDSVIDDSMNEIANERFSSNSQSGLIQHNDTFKKLENCLEIAGKTNGYLHKLSEEFDSAIEDIKNYLDICTNIYGALHRIKEEIKFQDSTVFEGMTSIRAILRGIDAGVNDRKIEKMSIKK